MVDILKNEDDRMIVKLSENYAYGTHMTTAALAENVILIDVLRSGEKSKRFTITADEMERLVDAWQQFKHTQQVAKELEQQRKVKMVEDAKKRIEDLGATALTIEQSPIPDCYNIDYAHNERWNKCVHVSSLDESLTALINRITHTGMPLKSDGVPPEQKTTTYSITWTGTVPPNTSSSIDF